MLGWLIVVAIVAVLLVKSPGIVRSVKGLFTADEGGFSALYESSNPRVLAVLRIGFNVCCYGLQLVLSPILLALIVGQCLRTRRARIRRRKSGEKPRLVWGPYPNANCVDLCRSLRAHGYVCDTVVYYNFSRIWDASRFDFCLTERLKHLPYVVQALVFRTVGHVAVFLMILEKYDIVHGYFWPGYLRDTFFAKLEIQLLHLAGCLQVNTTVGGDVCLTPQLQSHVIKHGIMDMYPLDATPARQREKQGWVRYYSKHSDFIILQCSYMIDMLSRWDLLTTNYVPIDTDYWSGGTGGGKNGHDGVVRIGHSPNHRALKGSNFLIKAINELRREGLRIELVLLENHQNSEVRDLLRGCDIVVADLVLQGYSIMAMEGMALSLPVVQDVSDPHYNRVFKLYTGLDEAPFVSAPLESLKDSLRDLITDPVRRTELGEKGREYVLKYHSYEAVSRFWQWIYQDIWHGARERVSFYHPDWPLSPISSLNQIAQDGEMAALREVAQELRETVRTEGGRGRIAVYPLNDGTMETARKLYLGGGIVSDDYLVHDGSALPQGVDHFPQAVVSVDTLSEFGCDAVLLLDGGAEMRAELERVLPESMRVESALLELTGKRAQ